MAFLLLPREEIYMRNLASLRACLALGLFFVASTVDAQSFSNSDIDRYYRGGTYVPHDGMTYTQRYGYGMNGAIFYPGYNAQNLIMMDYLDRLDRAEKFGYAIPRDPFLDPAANPSGWRFGTGWRLFRRQ